MEAVKSLPSMWLPTHCGSLLFAEHSPGLKDPMHNRNSLVEGNQVSDIDIITIPHSVMRSKAPDIAEDHITGSNTA